VGESVDQVTPKRDYIIVFFFTLDVRLCLYTLQGGYHSPSVQILVMFYQRRAQLHASNTKWLSSDHSNPEITFASSLCVGKVKVS
jgi:hypothetical protein